MNELYQKNYRLWNIVFIVITLSMSFPYLYTMKFVNNEGSWVYALNMFTGGYIYGRDMVFTYGPLGFFLYCENEGNNMIITAIIWIFLLLIHGFLLYQYLFKFRKGSKGNLVILSVFLYVLADVSAKEYYLCYLALFSLILALNGYKKDVYFFAVILAFSLYIKFSLFMMLFGIFVIYLLFGIFYDKKLYKYHSVRMLAGIIMSPLIYFIISGFSIVNFINYIRGSLEITSGYNVAMSTNQNDIYVLWIIIATCAFLICIILGIKSGIYNFMIMAFVGFSLFMCYKHGFVRADAHVSVAMNSMLIFLSFIPAFLQWEQIFENIGKVKKLYVILISFVITVAVLQTGFDTLNIVRRARDTIFRLPASTKAVMEQQTKYLNPLPDSILSEIGGASVTIYPWEVTYCISNDLNYILLATIQAYSTYTPYLDRISAQKFLDSNAPEYILLTNDIIDNRWPFIECPQTWEAIRNNYYITLREGNLFLLKHNTNIKNISYEYVKTSDCTLSDLIELDGADFLKVKTRLSIKGTLAKIFWKVPEVTMHVYYSDGTEETRRILLDMFSEGAELGTLVSTNENLIDILNDTGHLGAVSKISFEGDGVKYYKHAISIEFYKTASDINAYPNENIRTAYAREIQNVNFSSFKVQENAVKYCVDIEKGNEYYKILDGWAYITDVDASDMAQCDICIEIDGKYYKCDKMPRDDVKEAFGLPTNQVGYSVRYDSGQIGSICFIDLKNKVIYKGNHI